MASRYLTAFYKDTCGEINTKIYEFVMDNCLLFHFAVSTIHEKLSPMNITMKLVNITNNIEEVINYTNYNDFKKMLDACEDWSIFKIIVESPLGALAV
ncbi:hypothetical protein GGH92_000317 [Coemansia sp. RSA 2673]|nr:hypothetical protein GGH13_003934 [Coemansia sp. S155-1]KAJ2353988.1 hypothetical protein GGH92_000317 [Coemansia sp. RSA 2673]